MAFSKTQVLSIFDNTYNLNASSILTLVTTYGPKWLTPLSVLDARLLQLSFQLSF